MILTTKKQIRHFSMSVVLLLTHGAGFALADEEAKKKEQEKDAPSALGESIEVLDERFNKKELQKFLKSRTSPSVFGRLNSYSSLLYAMNNVALMADDQYQWDNEQELYSPFPESYKPLWKEKLDMIARQVSANWSYNHDTGYWMLQPGPMPYPYTLKIADGWEKRDQGNHVVFIPPIAKVGMDIYVQGHYTPTEEDGSKLFKEVREKSAMMWASRINKDSALEQMEIQKIDGEDALFFQSPTPRSANLIWRQWAVVKNGWSILIVSVMEKDNEAVLLPQVEAMVKSVRIDGVKDSAKSKATNAKPE